MAKYGKLFILIGYFWVFILQFFPSSTINLTQLFLLIWFLITYFLSNPKEYKTISKIKYLILFSVFVFFYFTVPLSEITFSSFQSGVLQLAYFVVIFQFVLLAYIMLKETRLREIEKKKVD